MGTKYIQFTLSTTDHNTIYREFEKRQKRDTEKGNRIDPDYHREYPLDWAGMHGPIFFCIADHDGVYRSMHDASIAVVGLGRRNDPVAVRYKTDGGHTRTLVAGRVWV